jgi:hypothetical protein
MEDEAAKEAALQSEAPIFHLTPVILPPSITLKFCLQEEKVIIKTGDYQNSQGKMDFA